MRNLPRFGDGRWRLYNIVTDPGETRDLAAEQPELLAAMRAAYDDYAVANGVLEMPPGYDVQRQVARNAMAKQIERYWWVLAIAAAAALAVVWLAVMLLRRLYRRRPA